MALYVHCISITDDHTSRSVAEAMSQLQLDQGSPTGPEACQELLRDLAFQTEHHDKEQYSQFVFQGQCLILGDSRVGKTSLVKSITGKPFDNDEPSTKGVQTSLVDRKWQNLDAETGLKFGSFKRFYKSVRYVTAMFESEGYSNLYDQESLLSPVSKILSLCWIISFICLWLFDTPSVNFSILSVLVLVTATAFPFALRALHFVSMFQFLVAQLSILRSASLITGLFALTLLAGCILVGHIIGIDCCSVEFSLGIGAVRAVVRHFHLLVLWVFVDCVVSDIVCFLIETYRGAEWEFNDESSLPGVVKYKNHTQFLIFANVFTVLLFFDFGYFFALTTTISVREYCQLLHFSIITCSGLLLFWFIRTMCKGSHVMEVTVGLVLCIFIEKNSDFLTSFHSLTTYAAILAGCVIYTLVFISSNYGVNQASAIYKYIFVQKFALDYQKLKRALSSQFLNLKLSILDFAGDEEYYAYHHLFLKNQAIYVLVFNMEHFVIDNFKQVTAKIQRLRFWLESICSQVAPKSPVFLVGTHRGNMEDSCLHRLEEHLQQNFWHSFSDELVINDEDRLTYFPVENRQGKNDRGIQNLQRKIICTAEQRKKTVGCKVPFSWIKIQDAIINRRQSKKAKFCVTLKQFPTSVGNFICSNWSKETLKYFHEKGIVIYIDPGQDSELSNWVLLKPEILVDAIIQLVTPPTNDEMISEHGFRRDWTLLHTTGMLTKSLLKNILGRLQENEEAMKGFLEEYDIICPLFYKVNNEKEEAEVTHFVPSLLPTSVNGNTPVWYNDPTDKKLFVFFKRFLPEPLFYHLLSRAHRLSSKAFSKGQPVIYRDVGRFWFSPTQPYRLLLLKKENMIEVTFSCRLVFREYTIITFYKMPCPLPQHLNLLWNLKY